MNPLPTAGVWTGRPYPLGATVGSEGTNFALFSENATRVDLCLFQSDDDIAESVRVPMSEYTDGVWHCFVPGIGAGQLYGYRVTGPFEPENGHRFNDSKVLLDPYARAIAGLVDWGPEMFGYPFGTDDLQRDARDSAPGFPKCVVVASDFDWSGDRAPDTPLAASVIYEVHVKGFSKLCPEVPEALRGTYAALGSEFAVNYLRRLGVTAVELLPVHHFVNDDFLEQKGLSNYWGYNSIGFFAPHSAYSSSGVLGQQVNEFKQMVKNLHAAGIEVILDVVYNHTGEGNHMGPTLCFRGIDNLSYYRTVPDNRRYYMDYTGCGNSLNMMHPRTLQLIMDSLRYWVTEMRVDGFRFDLASTLARELHEVNRLSAFFDIIHQDPVLSRVKLIAEPWDLGDGGYQVGNFPVLWAEWNGRYRDCLRSYWKGDAGQVPEFASRLTGSSDLYQHDGKRPYASINFITAHDGFTLHDLVSYNEKHNEANGEGNNDGDNNNASWNCGAEGPTDDPEVLALRRRQMRNLFTTLLLSQGVPMISGGDEFARTQRGNNNAYCQDNDISWFPWQRTDEQNALTDYVAGLIRFRHEHPVFRRPKFFQGRPIRGLGIKDVMWLNPTGAEMNDEEWETGYSRSIAVIFSGQTMDVRDQRGQPVTDDTFVLLFNAHHEPITFNLPRVRNSKSGWTPVIHTEDERGFLGEQEPIPHGGEFTVGARAMAVLRHPRPRRKAKTA
ncbi:MAG: glycogen debranching protein GlgX [Terrimicrobiaceae bacterium]|nr:glycogen debranching protein GlgX [Terrimicrobiaceae bacterium]